MADEWRVSECDQLIEILLKVALSTITMTPNPNYMIVPTTALDFVYKYFASY